MNATRDAKRQRADDFDRAADELERIGFIEDPDRRRAIQRGISLLRLEANTIYRAIEKDPSTA